MKNSRLFMFVFCLSSSQLFAGPFANYANRPIESEPAKLMSSQNVLCGIHKSWDGDYLCVDGVWLTVSQFERKFKVKVKKIEELVVSVTGGRILVGASVLNRPTQMEKMK